MASTIKLKRGSGEPGAGALVEGEPAFDLTNKRLYTEDTGGTVIEVGTNPTTLQVDGTLTVGVDDTGYDVEFFGATTGKSMLWDESADSLIVTGTVDVTGTVTADKVDIGDGVAGGTSEILFSDNVSSRGKIIYDHSSSPETLVLQTTGTTALSIDNSQNISIPNGNLDVTGTVTSDGMTVEGDVFIGYTANVAGAPLQVNTAGTTTLGLSAWQNPSHLAFRRSNNATIGGNTTVADNDVIGKISFLGADGSNYEDAAFIQVAVDGTLGTDTTDMPARIEFATSADNSDSPTTRMTILSGGNVGIGTTAPAEMLEIYNATSPAIQLNDGGDYKSIVRLAGNDLEIRGSSGAMEFYTGAADGDSSTQRMTITSAGNVCIGTASGSNKLTVNGNQVLLANGELKFADSANSQVATIKNSGGSGTSQLDFLTGATPTQRMRIDADGNLSLGTDAPIYNFGDDRTTLTLKGKGSTDYSTIQLGNYGTTNNSQGLGFVNFYDGTNENARIGAYRSSDSSSGELRFYSRAQSGSLTEGMRVTSTGNVSIINGNLVVASGHGIDFSATGNSSGSVDSELLDDYEEGTWTPTLLERSGGTVREIPDIVYSTSFNGAWYTKVGNVVNFGGNIRVTANGNPTSSYELRIGGLPFTSVNPGGTSSDPYGRGRSAISITIFSGLDGLAADEVVQPNITQNANYITMSYFDSGSGAGFSMPSTFVQDDCYLSFGGSFVTAA